MKSAPTTQRSTSRSADFEDRAAPSRLQLKPKSTIATGYVDGGWWPRSHDLEAELPALLALLALPFGSVERVSYHLGDWGSAAKAISADGGAVRLSGFRSQTAGTIDVLGPRQRITLLVVPPETSSQTAHDVMAIAARRDNADGVASLLRSAAGTSETRGERGIARRTLDGGVIAERD